MLENMGLDSTDSAGSETKAGGYEGWSSAELLEERPEAAVAEVLEDEGRDSGGLCVRIIGRFCVHNYSP